MTGTCTYCVLNVELGAVKIGISKTPKQRLVELQVGCATPLKLIGAIDGNLERELHRRFEADRLSGEWFRVSEDVRRWVIETFNFDVVPSDRRPPALRSPKVVVSEEYFGAELKLSELGDQIVRVVDDATDEWVIRRELAAWEWNATLGPEPEKNADYDDWCTRDITDEDWERCDGLVWIEALVDEWREEWIGHCIDGRDESAAIVWLVFWESGAATKKLRTQLARLAGVTVGTDFIRIGACLWSRNSEGVEFIDPDELEDVDILLSVA